MAVVYSKVLLFDPPLIYTAPDTCVFGAVNNFSDSALAGLLILMLGRLFHYTHLGSMHLIIDMALDP